MNIGTRLVLALLCFGAFASESDASPVTQVYYDSVGFLQGQQAFSDSFDISGPGTLTVTLTNLVWPEQLADLDLVMSTDGGMLGPEMGAGSQTFNVKGGRYYANWFGNAQGPLNVGVYGLEIEFCPSGTVPVPLPTSISLFLSGLLLLVSRRYPRLSTGFTRRTAAK